MALFIDNRPLEQADGLSQTAQAVLGLIDGGTAWVAWAIRASNARYAFADENALVSGVQAGLHGRPLMFLPALGLTVGPARLMVLTPVQLTALAKAGAAARKALAGAGLLTAADLAAGDAWLAGQGGGEAAVFSGGDIGDRIALARLAAADTAEAALGQEASAFALAEARTPAEFGDYRRLYLALAARPGAATAAERQALARAGLDILLPWMFTALDCPSLPQPANLDAATQALLAWLRGGRRLGFASAAAGARQIAERTDFTPEAADVGALIAGYLGQASVAIAAGPVSGALNQDGQSMRLQAGGATIDFSPSGDLSLDDFQPTPEPA
jgi:hypothetical protein